jgi:hypothetical protein
VTVSLAPSAFIFSPSTMTVGRSFPVNFSIIPTVITTNTFVPAQRLAPAAGSLSFLIGNSQPSVGSVKPASVTLNPGDTGATGTFTPLTTGTTVLTLTQPPGYTQPTPPAQLVVVVN